MACLIGLIDDSDGRPVRGKLEMAYRAVAQAYLDSLRPSAPAGETLADLVRAVNDHAAVVDLRPARAKCDLVCGGEMDAGEVRNGLRHAEVILGACDLVDRIGLVPKRTCPTQGSVDCEGKRAEDVEGVGFVIDVFGGADITNNSKAAEILATLARVKAADPARRTFVAMRREALVGNTTEYPGWKPGGRVRGRHARAKWSAEADVILREEDDRYVLLELDRITVIPANSAAT